MTMVQKTNYFCTMEQVEEHLPEHLRGRSLQQWIAISKNGDWAPVFHFGNGTYFRKASVLKACLRLFGKTHPELIAGMNQAGFTMPD
jgi:hypothetical protein